MSSEIPVKQIDPSSDTSDNNKNTGTVELYASRKKIYVKGVKKGFFQRAALAVVLLLLHMCRLGVPCANERPLFAYGTRDKDGDDEQVGGDDGRVECNGRAA